MNTRRLIHRQGAVFRATLHPPGGTPAPGSVDSDRPALVRISNTFGWPRPLPDWVGLGIRVLAHPDEADEADEVGAPTAERRSELEPALDLLLASAHTRPDLWCRLKPRRDVLVGPFSSAVRYPLGGVDQVVVAALIDGAPPTTLAQLLAERVPCPLRYRLDAATDRGTWRGFGELELTEQLADDPTLRFTPPRRGPRLLTTARRLAYPTGSSGSVEKSSSSEKSPSSEKSSSESSSSEKSSSESSSSSENSSSEPNAGWR
jgi:hypothetical protein